MPHRSVSCNRAATVHDTLSSNLQKEKKLGLKQIKKKKDLQINRKKIFTEKKKPLKLF